MSTRIPLLLLLTLAVLFGLHVNASDTKYSKEERATIQEINRLHIEAKTYLQKEDSLFYAMELLDRALGKARALNYSSGIIQLTYDLGLSYLALSNHPKATSNFYLCMKEAEFIQDSASQAKAYTGLGLVMYNLTKWEDAVKNFNKSKRFQPDSTRSNKLTSQDYLISLCYFQQEMYAESQKILTALNKQAIASNNAKKQLETELYLTNISSKLKVDNQLLEKYDSLLQQFEEREERVGICFTLEGKARALFDAGRVKEASVVALKSLEMARSLEMNYLLHSILDIVIKTEYEAGNYKDASTFLLELNQLKKQTMDESSTTQVAMLMAEHNFHKKEANYNAQIQEQSRQRIIYLLSAIGLLLLAVFFFMSRKSIAKERKLADGLLHNILPEETAAELKEHGFARAKSHKEVTIVFADVQEFTKIASTLKPQVLVKILDVYFGKFDQIVTHLGIEKIKTIGDAYMFVAGLQKTERNSAVNGVKAAMQMIDAIHACAEEMQMEYGTDFKFRFGAHTGDVTSGVVGTVKYSFDVWGDAVNIASRMESNSEPMKLNVSETTYDFVKDDFNCNMRGNIPIKNRGSMNMYFVHKKGGH